MLLEIQISSSLLLTSANKRRNFFTSGLLCEVIFFPKSCLKVLGAAYTQVFTVYMNKIIHINIWTAVKNDHPSKFSNLSNWIWIISYTYTSFTLNHNVSQRPSNKSQPLPSPNPIQKITGPQSVLLSGMPSNSSSCLTDCYCNCSSFLICSNTKLCSDNELFQLLTLYLLTVQLLFWKCLSGSGY